MLDKNKENYTFQHKYNEEKSLNSSQANKDIDEYDKYLKMELENFKKPASIINYSSDKIPINDNSNSINVKNFTIDKENSILGKKSEKSINQNNNTLNNLNNINNLTYNDDFFSEKIINNPNQENILSNIKNISINDISNDVILNNLENFKSNNKEKVISNNLLARSENGNPNNNNNHFNLNINDSINNIDINNNLNNNIKINIDNNRYTFKQTTDISKFFNEDNKNKEQNLNTDLNDYLTDNNLNEINNKAGKREDYIVNEDNQKYMFSNNIEYSNYNINTNSYQENIDIENTTNIVNNYDKSNFNKVTKSNNFESINTNLQYNLPSHNINEYNLEDDLNVNSNIHENKNLILNQITNSNISNLHNFNMILNNNNNLNSNLDNEKANKENFILNDKQLTDYDNIINHYSHIHNNNLINNLKNNNQFQNNFPNYNLEKPNLKEIENLKNYHYEKKENLKEELEKKFITSNLSLHNKNIHYRNTNRNPLFSFDFDAQASAYIRANYLSFSPKNIKTLSDQTISNSELLATKNNTKSINININENNGYSEENDNEFNNKINYIEKASDLENEYRKNNKKKKLNLNDDFINYEKEDNSKSKNKKSFNNYETSKKPENHHSNLKENKEKKENKPNINKTDFKRKSGKKHTVKIPENKFINNNIMENNLNIKRIIKNKNASSKEIYNLPNDLFNNNYFDNNNNDIYEDINSKNLNIINQLISNPDSDIRIKTLEKNSNQDEIEIKNNTIFNDNNNKLNININDSIEITKDYITIDNTKSKIKIKALKEKIEEKLREEFESKIKQKEKEITEKTKVEFEEALKKLKNELEKNLDLQRKKIEDEMLKEWEGKYENLVVECKAKLRNEKEKKLVDNMYQKLKPVVEKEIYKKEYIRVEEKIRNEIEEKIKNEIQIKKSEEVEKIKKKFEFYAKNKVEEIENNVKSKCKEQFENDMKKEVEKKEKEIKINYLNKFESYKTNLENQLKKDYENKKKDLMKEIEEIKAKIYSQKCAENLKIHKINKIKENLEKSEIISMKKAEKIEKILSSKSKEKYENFKKSSSSGFSKSKRKIDEKYYKYFEISTTSFKKKNMLNKSNDNNNKKSKMNNSEFCNSFDENIQSPVPKKKLSKNIHNNNSVIKQNENQNKKSSRNSKMNSPFSEFNNPNLLNDDYFSENYVEYTPNSEIISKKHKSKFPRNDNLNQMNAINIFELNRRLKETYLGIKNIERKEKTIVIKESPIFSEPENIDFKKSLTENLNEIIEKNSKLSSPSLNTEKTPQIFYRKSNNYIINTVHTNYTYNSPEKNIVDLTKLNKNIIEINNKRNVNNCNIKKSNSNINNKDNQSYYHFNNIDNNKNLYSSNNYKDSNLINKNDYINKHNYVPIKTFRNLDKKEKNFDNMSKNLICISLSIDKNTPVSLIEFGKFLVKYIEKEENYKEVFVTENKKLKESIKRIFEKKNYSDHCLLDYILELWEKLEISYSIRYSMLMDFCKKNNPAEIYNILDLETEYITEYYKNSQSIFVLIKNRERNKNALQIKSIRNELSFEDKHRFKNLTLDIQKKIKTFKQKYNIPIVWRGLDYEFVNS